MDEILADHGKDWRKKMYHDETGKKAICLTVVINVLIRCLFFGVNLSADWKKGKFLWI